MTRRQKHEVDRISMEIQDDGVEIEKAQQMIVIRWNLYHVCSSFDDDCDQLNWKVRLSCGSVDVGFCAGTKVSLGPSCSRRDSVLL